MSAPSHPSARLAWGVWGLAAAFYLIAYYHRVAPAVLTAELTADFGLSTTALGNLSAFYFFSYVAMQVPTGIIVDRWGPRRLLTAGALVAAAGTLAFALAPNLAAASAGRLLLGGSVAVAFVGVLKLAGHWLAPHQFAFSTGLTPVVGFMGTLLAGVPLRLAVDRFGWRAAMAASALATLALAAAIWLLVRDDPRETGHASHFAGAERGGGRSVIGAMREVLRYRNTWLLAVAPGGLLGTLLAFGGLWGVPYLVAAYGLSTVEAAATTTLLMMSWAAGGPAFGALSDRLGRRKPLYALGLLVVTLGWAVVMFASPSYRVALGLLVTVGFCSGCMMPGFAFAKESVPVSLAGTVTGVVNTGVMVGPMILQPAAGWMLGRATGAGGAPALSGYRDGFALMMAWLVVSLIAILFTRETRCRQQR